MNFTNDAEERANNIGSWGRIALIAAELDVSKGISGSPDLGRAFRTVWGGSRTDDRPALHCLRGMKLVQDNVTNNIPVITDLGRSVGAHMGL